jgi:predicted alpha/beta hydrolase family esterase
MKKQVLVLHGGDTFKTYDEYISFLKSYDLEYSDLKKQNWKMVLGEELGEDFDVVLPRMPNKNNARFLEWQIIFEKILPLMADNLILVGHSLGGIFLAKYLSEHECMRKIKATFLIAAPFDSADSDYSLVDFELKGDLKKFEQQGGKIFVYHSKDDPVVPFVDMAKFQVQLPSATFRVFEDRGHFGQERFPELIAEIKNL